MAAPAADELIELARCSAAVRRPEPAWMAERRQAAAELIAGRGFPTRKDEDWRYLPLDEVLAQSFELPAGRKGALDEARRLLETTSAGLGTSRLVFVNGRFSPPLSRRGSLPPETRLCDVSTALAEPRAWPLSTSGVTASRHAFGALSRVLSVDGAFLELPPATSVDDPIELVYLTVPDGRRLLVTPRTVLHLGEGSRATVVETHAGEPGAGYLAVAATEVHLDPGARLEHYRLQLEPDDALHVSSLEARQRADSRLRSHLVALGGHIARHEVDVLLEGEEAEVDLDGLYLPSGDQYHDQPVLVDHAAPRCASRQRYAGVVDGSGHAVFNGHVVVRPGAAGTDARQSNANLLLSERAEVDTRPRLEIFADDVACSHGATVGRLDADALFYLRSRGIPEPVARAVLVEGFARQMTERIELDPLRTWAERLIADRIGSP